VNPRHRASSEVPVNKKVALGICACDRPPGGRELKREPRCAGYDFEPATANVDGLVKSLVRRMLGRWKPESPRCLASTSGCISLACPQLDSEEFCRRLAYRLKRSSCIYPSLAVNLLILMAANGHSCLINLRGPFSIGTRDGSLHG
jgi:hypothetical protein